MTTALPLAILASKCHGIDQADLIAPRKEIAT